MTIGRTVLNVMELGARILPSAVAAVPTAAAAAQVSATAAVLTNTGVPWTGHGRFTLTTNRATNAKTYAVDGSAAFGSAGFFAISGSITTVGSKSGQATGRVVVSDSRGTLILNLTGPTQSANAALPATFTFKVATATGFFSRYSGQGTFKLSATLLAGYTNTGHFDATVTSPAVVGTKPPAPPPVQSTAVPSWDGQGRYTIATNRSTNAKTYALQGTADFGRSGFFAINGTVQTVGNVLSGRATGRITLCDSRGTLVLALTGPTQSRNAGLPGSLTYKVVSGTGFFAHFSGQGSFLLSAPLFPGYNDRGHFEVAVKPTSK